MTITKRLRAPFMLFVAMLLAAWLVPLNAFASENEGESEEGIIPYATTYTVAFDPDDGTQYQDFYKTEVVEGGLVTDIPANPVRAGYTFGGWAHAFGPSGEPMLWNFATMTVTENTTLWAVWNKSYIVAFDPDDGTQYQDFYKTQVVEGGLVTDIPADPIRAGYVFGGWAYAFDASDEPLLWDFATMTVTDNTTLWAVWTVAPDEGGFTVDPPEEGAPTELTSSPAPTNATPNAKGSLPKTGDMALIAPFAIAAALGALALGTGAWVILRKRNQAE